MWSRYIARDKAAVPLRVLETLLPPSVVACIFLETLVDVNGCIDYGAWTEAMFAR
jgi:hypothetical protein